MSAASESTHASAELRMTSVTHRVASLLSPLHLAGTLASSWPLIVQFSRRELTSRNKGTTLGMAWTFLQPLLMLAVYTFVFAVVWKARWSGSESESNALFATSVFSGLIVYEVFGATVGVAPVIVVVNANYVKKVIFPLEVLPLAQLGASLCVCAVSVAILLAGNLMVAGTISRTLWLFPLALAPLICLTAGLSWLLASLGVFLRDLKQAVGGVLLPVMFFMTPIFYPPERVPESFRWIIAFNPLASIVDAARRTLLQGREPDWASLAYAFAVGLVAMQLGYAFFMKSKRSFADVI